jgi:hypothetical protein
MHLAKPNTASMSFEVALRDARPYYWKAEGGMTMVTSKSRYGVIWTRANFDDRSSIGRGEMAFQLRITDPVEVYKFHLKWDDHRRTMAEYYFCQGYKKFAQEAGRSPWDIAAALRLFGWCGFNVNMTEEDKALLQRLHDEHDEH